MDEISKKELLNETNISYGQLYRWKREGLIPEEWFVKRPAFTGQETFFPKDRILERVKMILEKKDEQTLEDIRRQILGADDGELDILLRETVSAAELAGNPTAAVLFETNDGKHFLLLSKDGKASSDGGIKILTALSEKEVRDRVKALVKSREDGGKQNGN